MLGWWVDGRYKSRYQGYGCNKQLGIIEVLLPTFTPFRQSYSSCILPDNVRSRTDERSSSQHAVWLR